MSEGGYNRGIYHTCTMIRCLLLTSAILFNFFIVQAWRYWFCPLLRSWRVRSCCSSVHALEIGFLSECVCNENADFLIHEPIIFSNKIGVSKMKLDNNPMVIIPLCAQLTLIKRDKSSTVSCISIWFVPCQKGQV